MLNNSTSPDSVPMEVLGQNLSACHHCPRRQARCAGACACMEDGRDIVEHARAGDCPLGKHARGPAAGLGDVVASLAKRIGADRAAAIFQRITGKDCGCQKRRRRLNELLPFEQDRPIR